MAVARPAPRGASTVTQPLPSTTQKVSVTTRSALAFKRPFFTEQDVVQPNRLYQLLYQIADAIIEALRIVGALPYIQGNRIANVVVSNAPTTIYLNHYLGRPFVGCIPESGYGATWGGYIPGSVTQPALPNGVTPAQQIPLFCPNNGTFSFWVF